MLRKFLRNNQKKSGASHQLCSLKNLFSSCLIKVHSERNFSHHQPQLWEKYLSKCSLIKHACSWRDKLIILWTVNNKQNNALLILEVFFFFFSIGVFFQTLTTHRTAGEGRGPSFIPLYHFHPLTNIGTFICNFGWEMTITYF